MNYLIRVLDGSRWSFEYQEPNKPFKANPLYDLRTDNDNLSVFEFEEEKNNLNEIILGFAAKRYGISKLQYIELDPDELIKSGFKIISAEEQGNTPVATANAAHKNIYIESAEKLIELAKLIYYKTENIQTVKGKDIKKLINESIANGSLDRDNLNCVLKKIFSIT